jgi:DNA-binding transcriptional LysR family regulator
MELSWIDDFLALIETRNFTRAADMRHTTQPAFSRRIQRLEEWLGVKLFGRAANPVTLTLAGEEFDKRALRLREDILDTRRAVRSVTSHFAQTLRIFTTNTIATSFLPEWLAQNKFGNYSLVVASIVGCLEAVRQHRANIALVARFEDDEAMDGLHPEVVGTDSLMLVAVAKIRPQIRLHKNQLSGPLMVYAPGTAYGAQVAKTLSRHGIRIGAEPLCESASAEALLAQVKAGLGAAWLPRLLFDKELQRCLVPPFLDIPYQIVQVKPNRQSAA